MTQGEVADLAGEYGGSDEPTSPDGWPAERVLRPKFLETILFAGEFQERVPRRGVRIAWARIEDTLELAEGSVPFPLEFRRCRFEKEVYWSRLQVAGILGLDGCVP